MRMTKTTQLKDDGRIIVYYWFNDKSPRRATVACSASPVARANPKAGRRGKVQKGP